MRLMQLLMKLNQDRNCLGFVFFRWIAQPEAEGTPAGKSLDVR